MSFDEYSFHVQIFEESLDADYWEMLFDKDLMDTVCEEVEEELELNEEKKAKASTTKQELAGVAGGLGAGIGVGRAISKAKAISGHKGRDAAIGLLKKSERLSGHLSPLNLFKKKSRQVAAAGLKGTFKKIGGLKMAAIVGIGLAVGNLVYSLGAGLAKSIMKKVETLDSAEKDLKKQLDMTEDPKQKEAIHKRLEQIAEKKAQLKENVKKKAAAEKEKKDKLPPEKKAQEKERAKIDAAKISKEFSH